MEQVFSGGCLCGAVRFTAKGPAQNATHCHCGLCRKSSGAPVVTWVSFPIQGVSFKGTRKFYQSSGFAKRSFCGECGTSLTFEDKRDEGWLDVTVAALDNPDACPPVDHIWTESALSFMTFADGLPQYPQRRCSEG